MPWSKNGNRRLILKQLATGILVKNEYIGRCFRPISGQIFNVRNNRAAWAGVHADLDEGSRHFAKSAYRSARFRKRRG